jgi:hypothetical protein
MGALQSDNLKTMMLGATAVIQLMAFIVACGESAI